MEKNIPFEKRSKKKQRELNTKMRERRGNGVMIPGPCLLLSLRRENNTPVIHIFPRK